MSHEQPVQAQESVLSTALWAGGALVVVAILAVYMAL